MTPDEERARALLARPVESRLVEPLAHYAALVLEANANFNLTGARSAEQFVAHILDSLTVVPYVRGAYVDIGSGAGLPGIPVALASGVKTVLVEATAKKAAFQKAAREALGLDGTVEVLARRAEEAGWDPEFRERFQSATIRAVASGPAAIELASPFLAIGGVAILQRGPADVSDQPALEKAARAVGCAFEAVVPVSGGRRLVLIRKAQAIGEAFPRRPGMAKKRPLA